MPHSVPTPESRAGILIVRSAAYALLAVLTIAVGLTGIFLIPTGPVIFGVNTSVAWLVAAGGNYALVRFSHRMDHSAAAPFVVAVVWIGCVLVLSISQPTRDVIVPADAPGVVFLLAGAAAAMLGIVQDFSRRGLGRRTSGGFRSPATRKAR